jgi:hypothetical protein
MRFGTLTTIAFGARLNHVTEWKTRNASTSRFSAITQGLADQSRNRW